MSFGIYGGVGYFTGFSVFLVPYPAARPEHGAIEGHGPPTVRPRSYQSDQVPPQASYLGGQGVGQSLEAPLERSARRESVSLGEQDAKPLHFGGGLGQHAKQLRDSVQVTHDHYHQGFEEEAIRVHSRTTRAALVFGGRRRDRQAVYQFDERDNQALVAYHHGYLHMCRFGVVTTMMWRRPRRIKPERGLYL